jgi:perosamine synthetase
MIPIYQPSIAKNQRKYVLDCIDTNWITFRGKYVNMFQDKFCEFTGSKYASVVSNGTAAIHLALEALGIGEGDEVIVPTFTYIATVNAVEYTRAKPVFCDSNYTDWQIDPIDIVKKITPSTKAILVVHLYGQACDMETICKIAKENDLYVIEDCAEAMGTKIGDRYVGTYGDISTYSFFGNKTITTGEGGMVCTDDIDLYERVESLKAHSVDKNKNYWHSELGYNYRMTNIQAAIGLAQLEECDKYLKRKREIANLYIDGLKGTPFIILGEGPGTTNSFWMCSLLLPDVETRNKLEKVFVESNIDFRPVFYPIHTMPMYMKSDDVITSESECPDGLFDFPVAMDISSRAVNIPSWPDLTNDQIGTIINTIKSV